MASKPKKVKNGWLIQICVNRVRESKTLPNRADVVTWAARRELELKGGAASSTRMLHETMTKFADEVSPKRKGERWEIIRLEAIKRDLHDKRLSQVTTEDIGAWRDKRLKTVSPGSVLRDMGLMSAVFEYAKELGWVEKNPIREARKPSAPAHRDRVLTRREIRIILRALGHTRRVRTMTQAVALAFCLALRTGMRAGELCGLLRINIKGDFAILPDTKSGKKRHVPLSKKALLLLERSKEIGGDTVLGLNSNTLDALFRKYRDKTGLDCRFHDTRHTAATWIAPKLQLLDLCRMFGWSDTKMALTYYNLTASDLAKRL